MARSRPNHLPRYEIGAHFLTARTYKSTPYFRVPACASIFCEELEAARARFHLHVLAFVEMPDHIHLVLLWDAGRMPELTISKLAWAVKGLSARRIVKHLNEDRVGGDLSVARQGGCFGRPANRWAAHTTGIGATRFGSKAPDTISTCTQPGDFRRKWNTSMPTLCVPA